MTITDKQLKWFRMNNADIDRARGEHNEIIAEALTTAYNQMSELESLLNDGMANAGETQYGLSRDDIHNKRIQIRSMARQFGMKMTEYPINLIDGIYKAVDRSMVKVKCDFCNSTDEGTKEQLTDRGWNKIFFDDIEQLSITSCWKHRLQAVKKAKQCKAED